MKLKKVLAAGALAAAAMVALPSVASAQTYVYPDGTEISDYTPQAGDVVTVMFNGFGPYTMVVIRLHSDPVDLGTFTADGNGVVRVTVNLPEGVTGSHHIVATGTDALNNAVTASMPVTISAADVSPNTGSNTPGSFLPRTGSNTTMIVTLGGLALVVGGAATFAGRRRPAAAETK